MSRAVLTVDYWYALSKWVVCRISSPSIPLNNVFYGAVGASYKFNDDTSGGLSLYLRQAPSSTSGDQADLTAFVTYKFAPLWKLQGYVLTGLASGSPDWAIGALVGRSF